MNWLQKISSGKDIILQFVPEICKRVQEEYNSWDQSGEYGDAELGYGGICQNFAEIMADVLNENGVEAITVESQCGEQHVWVIAKLDDGIYEVDIPYHLYETGGGYNWKKIQNVVFDSSSVVIHLLSHDTNEFESYSSY